MSNASSRASRLHDFTTSRLSSVPQLVQARVVDAQVVGDLVEDGLADLVTKSTRREAHRQVWAHVDRDAIRHEPGVAARPVVQVDALVQTEQRDAVGGLAGRWPFLDDHVDVVQGLDHPRGKFREGFVDDLLELVTPHRPEDTGGARIPCMSDLVVIPATLEHLDDVLQVVPGGNSAFGCTCQYFRLSSGDYSKSTGNGRIALLREQLAGHPAPGVLAYDGDQVVGWCGFAPRTSYERLMRSKTIPIVDDVAVWSIVCFMVRAGMRKRGTTKALLAGAIEYARKQGAPALEAYPIDPGGKRVNTADLYVGTVKTFEAAGFEKVVRTDSTTARLPRWLMRMELG